jgi:hypothetical protein
VRATRRALVEWLVQEYRLAGHSRPRAYLAVLRAQPGLSRTVGAAADLARERLKRVARRLRKHAEAEQAPADPPPGWLQVYRAEPESAPG